ncbi:MAG: glycoside hydrolase family 3 protein [Lewinella sp.]|nr:glycoside hydrolase family 3 protein [Lewinella sp.]
MQKVAYLLLFGFLTALFAGCRPAPAPAASTAVDDALIGQLIMVGFRGKTIEEMSPVLREQISRGQIGGVVLFDYDVPGKSYDRNIESPEQVALLVHDLQALAPRPLLVAIDQEGGRVMRLKPRYGFPTLPSAQYLGTLNDLDSTAFYARQNAQTLRALGINVNFAPVVDLNVNPDNPVIGGYERSFAAEPDLVTAHARRWIAAHDSLGIISVLKHFPGHGSSTSDSHVGFTDVSTTWSPTELLPYRTLLAEDHQLAVMTAHVFNAQLDSLYPATLSQRVIGGLLRQDIGFQGVVFSDDLQMKAVHELYDFPTIIEKSLAAGVDVLVFGNNLVYEEDIATRTGQTIRQLLAEGRITPERLRASHERIQALKRSAEVHLRED